ncbi:MAG: type II secretion system protein N [Mariprofundus sp.]|nr:type II secretion system protein N [Mariprofundus sp.]
MTLALPALKRLPLLSEFILVVLLAWLVAGWLLPEQEAAVSNNINSIETAAQTLPDLNSMVATTLFGQAAKKIQPVAPVVQQRKTVALTPLTLKLLGTVVAGAHSAAIIALTPSGKQSVFFIGDNIQTGVVLKTVEANAIIIDHNGSLERISLEQGKPIVSTSMPRLDRQTTAAPRAPPQRLNKRMNRQHLQQQLQNLPALLSQALARPNFSNGKINGFIISNIVPGSLYQQAGLQNGDIIMAINGAKITNAAQAMAIYAKLKSAPALDLQLQRGSGIQNIHFDIR